MQLCALFDRPLRVFQQFRSILWCFSHSIYNAHVAPEEKHFDGHNWAFEPQVILL